MSWHTEDSDFTGDYRCFLKENLQTGFIRISVCYHKVISISPLYIDYNVKRKCLTCQVITLDKGRGKSLISFYSPVIQFITHDNVYQKCHYRK